MTNQMPIGKLFHASVAFHVKPSHLIFSANQIRLHSIKVGPEPDDLGSPSKFKSGTPGTPSKFESGTTGRPSKFKGKSV